MIFANSLDDIQFNDPKLNIDQLLNHFEAIHRFWSESDIEREILINELIKTGLDEETFFKDIFHFS